MFDCVRTPRGKARPTGALHEVPPHRLLVVLLDALTQRTGLDPAAVHDLLVGCVTPVGDQGYNVAQAALLAAAWPDTVAAAQLNRYCASGLESVHGAAARIAAGWDDLLVAGGVESMGRVPLGSDGGALLQDPELLLESGSIPQGVAADLIATAHDFSREAVDAYALASQQRTAAAVADDRFAPSLVPIVDDNGLTLLDHDEHPGRRRVPRASRSSRRLSPKPGASASTTSRCCATRISSASSTSTRPATPPGSSTAQPSRCSGRARRERHRRSHRARASGPLPWPAATRP